MFFISSDHAGFDLKKRLKVYLEAKAVEFEDLGPAEFIQDDDYPDYAKLVSQKVSQGAGEGILICDTGIGMSICANRFKNVRAALCTSPFMAQHAREHNDANILVIGAQNQDLDHAKMIAKAFLESKFTGEERHKRRIEKIEPE